MVSVDCRGLQCPEPLIRTRDALKAAPGASAVTVLVDNPTSLENVRKFLAKSGFTCQVSQEGTVHRVVGARAHEAPLAEPEEQCGAPQPAGAKALVLITTETLGRGDDELGARLMKNFLGTLPELRGLWRVVLLNGGVKLAAQPGDALENLKKLASAGVSILVCGTCLGHYGLLEAKQVGETSNMLDIVTSLDLADKVIRP